MKAKKTFIFQLIIVLALSLMIPFQQTQAATLTDIPAGYQAEINELMKRGIISGYPDQTFRPYNKITREEVAMMIGIALNLNGEKRSTTFPDVNPASFGSGYIASAVERGIISGHTDGTFRPKDFVTRGHVSIMLERAFKLKGQEIAIFKDVSSTDKNLYSAVDAMYSNGITVGSGNGLFNPNKEINRAEFSALMARILNPNFRLTVKESEFIVNVKAGETLNVRPGPGMSYAPIGKLTRGTTVTSTSLSGVWRYVESPSISGYVHKDYLVLASEGLINEADMPKRYIAIDAGHGGSDPGATGNGLVEKQITLAVAKRVEKALEKENVKVLLTRTNDTFVGLEERVAIAERANVDALVSIHMNAFSSSSANGTETFYNSTRNSKVAESKQLATFIQNRLYRDLNTTNRGVKTANFAVTRTTFPAILVELAFISNRQDAQKLGSAHYQQIAADAITAGIMDFYRWKEQ